MVVSSSFGAVGASIEVLPSRPQNLQGVRLTEAIREKVNETGTLVSERVHLCEIVVIRSRWLPAERVAEPPDRLPFAGRADISAATPFQPCSRTK
jgi:hypothetical protein